MKSVMYCIHEHSQKHAARNAASAMKSTFFMFNQSKRGLSMKSVMYCIHKHSQKHTARNAASARSADHRRPQDHYARKLPPPRMRHPDRIRTVRFFSWCRLANRRTHASHGSRRRDPGHDRIGLDWVGREEGRRPRGASR